MTHIIEGLKDAEATDEKDVAPGTMKVALMRHQRRALAWGLKREATPEHRGGILADDQGLGKTVSMLAIIVSAPPPDDGTGAGDNPKRHILRHRGLLGRERGGQRVNREDFQAGGGGAGGGGGGEAEGSRRRGSASAGGGGASSSAPSLPHLPSCVCKDLSLIHI